MQTRTKPELKISVRALVEYFYRSGDLDLSTYTSNRRMQQGIRAHQKLQKQRPDNYEKEVTISGVWETEEFDLLIRGRIDGVYTEDSGIVLEEIKSVTRSPEEIGKHQYDKWWGQVKVYGAIYCSEKGLEKIGIQLSLYELESKRETIIREDVSAEELESFFNQLKEKYYLWAARQTKRLESRNRSMQALEFPFEQYRAGQRQMAVRVYKAIRDSGQLLIQAPTGIGKTMGVLFPGIKAIGMDLLDRIFYLTARTTGKEIAAKTIEVLIEKGLDCRVLVLTSKERICFKPQSNCNPEECEYAKGFYDRLGAGIDDIYKERLLNRETIELYGRKHRLCPFEFSLEAALWCDVIICDYNYAFDPRVYLRRFFESVNERYSFLVDESHNLVDRSRSMFSSELSKSSVLQIRRQVKGELSEISKLLGAINKGFLSMRKSMEDEKEARQEKPVELEVAMRKFLRATDQWLAKNIRTGYRKDLLEFYFEVNRFIWGMENYSEHYRTLLQREKSDLRIKLFCLDPSGRLAECRQRCQSVIFFSATLAPYNYYRELFGCDGECGYLSLGSPFPRENLQVKLIRLSTRYRQREQTLKQLSDTIAEFLMEEDENVMVFFPSYKYMLQALDLIREREISQRIIVQRSGMSEIERREFLKEFDNAEETRVGFAVMGGVFGEGIDLVGEKLKAAVIVGVGLPGIDQERELIRDYYEDRSKGYDYSYTYPGIIRVLQAAGRVVRTERDKGRILLIDDRFFSRKYRKILPEWWQM